MSHKDNFKNRRFIKIADMQKVYGISRATVYRWIDNGNLPEPTRLAPKTVGWSRAVLDAIFLK